MRPLTQEAFRDRDLFRAEVIRKGGKSILEQIKEGAHFSDTILKEEELDFQLTRQLEKDKRKAQGRDYPDTPQPEENNIFNSDGSPYYDEDGIHQD